MAHETGESLTDAIRVSLEERLRRLTAKRNASMLVSQVEEIYFAARAKEIFGDRILPGSEVVIEERGRY